MQYRFIVYWDEQTNNGFAFNKAPYPDPNIPHAGFIDYDSGPAGPELDPEWRGDERALIVAASDLGLWKGDASEWHPEDDWAEWVVTAGDRK